MDQTLDAFTKGYIEVALTLFDDMQFYNDTEDYRAEHTNDPMGAPEHRHFFYNDLAQSTINAIKNDCAKFQAEHTEIFADLPNDGIGMCNMTGAGMDFWYTRNHHGVGYWDGDWDEHGDKLTEDAHAYKEFELYLGDNGKIYAMGYETYGEEPKAIE